jgi:transcriptional regulator with XRE-family HTH domain
VGDGRLEEFYRRLGLLLATWRKRRGLSQEALAVQVQCDQSYISRVEAGQRHVPVEFLVEWADAVNVPFEDFASEVGKLWNECRRSPTSQTGE